MAAAGGQQAPVGPRVEHPVPGQQVRLAGRVDAASVAEVRLALHEAVDHGIGELVVDVRDLQLGDATGLGALLGAHRRAARVGRTLVLADVPPALTRLLAYARLTRVLRTRVSAARAG